MPKSLLLFLMAYVLNFNAHVQAQNTRFINTNNFDFHAVYGSISEFAAPHTSASVTPRKYEAAIEISDALRLGIYFDNGWKVVETRENLFQADSFTGRRLKFPPELENQFITCFEKEVCPNVVSSDLLAKIEEVGKPETDTYGLQFDRDFFAVLKKNNFFENKFAVVDLQSGRFINIGKYGRKYAFSANLQSILYADCEKDKVRCTVRMQSLRETQDFTALVLPFQIEDMQVSGNRLRLLVKHAHNDRQGFFDRALAWMGHPNTYYDWSLVEVNLHDLKQTEYPLHKNSANSWGRFICKWCDR
ncbi:hypothetical protein RF679_03390 [Undibacterium cyanobacteriorum]|uniref:Uncharacterized protein n=1 Tax=Undibacterium cyanobacteriorum TaxID=3073561 RepID=A0ABY9RJF0_9BURK|nr:hypothetical protein [Undibacterium sp. 20NA77.5]WMW81335.1 hypothetical protein RF679_03390 [Undibacterium sp. 20NA77.5]